MTREGVHTDKTWFAWNQLFFSYSKSRTSSLEAFKKAEELQKLSYKIGFGEGVSFEDGWLIMTEQPWVSAADVYRLRGVMPLRSHGPLP